MTEKRARVPGPDHPITIERNPARVVVMVAGRVIADTREAVTLREASYAPAHYVPRKDVDMTALCAAHMLRTARTNAIEERLGPEWEALHESEHRKGDRL
jgi:uncharacterized protein (DUF427 family)